MLRLDPGRGPDRHRADAPGLGGRRRVQRRPRPAPLLRAAHRVVTALADNPVGPPHRGPHAPGRRRPVACALGARTTASAARCATGSTSPSAASASAAPSAAPTGATPPSSQLRPGDVDWDEIFGREGARWFHCGGIFAALGETTADVAAEAMAAARRHGTIVSYDLNYRPSLWKAIGGQERAREVNRELAPLVDVMLGNEEDFSAALGFEVEGVDENLPTSTRRFGQMMAQGLRRLPEPRGGGHDAARGPQRLAQRLERGLLGGRAPPRGGDEARAGDPRPRRRRRLVRLGPDLRAALGLRRRRRRSSTGPPTAPSP